MRVAVVAANGKAGRLITEEAVNRGMDVTAVVRSENKSAAQKVISKDLFNLTREEVAGFDAIVDAVGAWTPDTVKAVPDAAKFLADMLKGTDARLIVVGGAGSLYVDPEHTKTVADVVEFPEAAMPVLNAHKEALDALRTYDDVNWTYVSPAAEFTADGERTGKYVLAGEEYTTNTKGESLSSYADYAIAIVDEIENASHIKERISVLGE